MKKVNVELASTQQKFYDFYKTSLQSLYQELEQERHTCLRQLFKTLFALFATILIVLLLFQFNILTADNTYEQWFSLISTVAVIFFVIMLYMPFLQYRNTTKCKVMKKLISFWGKFTYCGSDIIGPDTIKRAELFSYFNRSDVDDSFKGEYRGTNIKISEQNLKIHGNRGETNIFSGVMIMLELPQKNRGKTIALNRGRNLNLLWNNPLLMMVLVFLLSPSFLIYYYYFTEPGVPFSLLFAWVPILFPLFIIGVIYLVYRRYNPKKATQKVKLEGLLFIKKWKVLTDNQVEARYILTPLFMEKMLEIKRLFHGKHIDFSFWDNKLLIAIHTRKDMFETTSLFTPALSYHKIRDVVSQIYSIFAIIDVVLDSRGNNNASTKCSI